eukprot:COSAG02_NODE_7286_length_3084_cov_6.649702_4_plen_87_part_00
MGHHDGKKDAGNQISGTRMKPFSEWAGGVHEGVYLSRLAEQVEAEVEIDPLKPGLRGVEGYEMWAAAMPGVLSHRLRRRTRATKQY